MSDVVVRSGETRAVASLRARIAAAPARVVSSRRNARARLGVTVRATRERASGALTDSSSPCENNDATRDFCAQRDLRTHIAIDSSPTRRPAHPTHRSRRPPLSVRIVDPATMTRDDDGDDDLAALWETTREASEADADDHPSVSGRRATCESCGRPARACLCPNLPETPFPTRGALVILTHPNEHKRALATGWILPRCLRRCAVLTRRSPPDAFLRMLGPADADDDTDGGVLPADAPIYLLYPAPHATDVTRVDVRADAESLQKLPAKVTSSTAAAAAAAGGGRSRAASLRNSPPLAKRSGTPHTCASPSTPRGDRRGRWWCARWRR